MLKSSELNFIQTSSSSGH